MNSDKDLGEFWCLYIIKKEDFVLDIHSVTYCSLLKRKHVTIKEFLTTITHIMLCAVRYIETIIYPLYMDSLSFLSYYIYSLPTEIPLHRSGFCIPYIYIYICKTSEHSRTERESRVGKLGWYDNFDTIFNRRKTWNFIFCIKERERLVN